MEHTETITKLTQELVEQLGFQADVEVKLEGSMYYVHLHTFLAFM
jgi:hypothetical protein